MSKVCFAYSIGWDQMPNYFRMVQLYIIIKTAMVLIQALAKAWTNAVLQDMQGFKPP